MEGETRREAILAIWKPKTSLSAAAGSPSYLESAVRSLYRIWQ